MRAAGDIAADFVEMVLHRLGIGIGHDQGSTGAACRTDGPEEICTFIALIGRQAGTRTLLCPDSRLPVLLSDAAFILKPNLDLLAL